jgi:Zn-dependent protease
MLDAVAMEEDRALTVSIFCPGCNQRIHMGDRSCPGCGRGVTSDEKDALRRRWEATGAGATAEVAAPRRRAPPADRPAATLPPLPPRPDLPAPSASGHQFDETWNQFVAANRSRQGRLFLAIAGVAIFALVAAGSMDLVNVAILMGVLLFHELGHLLAMRIFGYKDLAVFFVPFLGAVATGRNQGAPGWQRGLITLAGPVPGLLAGWAMVLFAPEGVRDSGHLASAVGTLFVVNGFNLLPVLPLDGGRLLNLALFSRRPRLETVFTIAAGVAVIFIGIGNAWWLLAAVGAMTIVMAMAQRRVLDAAHQLRPVLASAGGELDALTEDQRRELYRSAEQVVASIERDHVHEHSPLPPERRQKMLTGYMRLIYDRAATEPAGPLAAAVLVTAYLASCALIWPLRNLL